jgi:YVTN family beta-propeller protein
MALSRLIAAGLALAVSSHGGIAQTRTSAPTGSSTGPLLFVSNESSRDVTVVRLSDLAVIATIPMGERPRGIQSSPDRRRVYVALSDSIPSVRSPGDAIGVIDVASRKLATRYAGGTDPEQFAVTPDGTRLYAANEDAVTS